MKMNMAALEAGVPLDDLPIIDAQYGDLKKLEVTVSQLVKRHRDDNPQFDSLHSSSGNRHIIHSLRPCCCELFIIVSLGITHGLVVSICNSWAQVPERDSS